MSIKILAFAAGLVVASAALAQPTQLEVNNAWAGATPGKAENGAAYVSNNVAHRRPAGLGLYPGREESRTAHDVDAGHGDENEADLPALISPPVSPSA